MLYYKPHSTLDEPSDFATNEWQTRLTTLYLRLVSCWRVRVFHNEENGQSVTTQNRAFHLVVPKQDCAGLGGNHPSRALGKFARFHPVNEPPTQRITSCSCKS